MKDDDVTIEEIQAYLNLPGITIEGFARKVKVNTSTVWRWKDGTTKKPKSRAQKRLKKILRKKV